MRYAKGHKEETRQAILEKASERFRRDGINAVGIKSLMSDAGLTHGGFYAHFNSRESLVAEAAEEALKRTLELLRGISSNAEADRKLEAFVNGYLSPQHYEDMAFGCAGAALAPEIAREGEDTRRRFTAGIERIVEYLAEILPPDGSPELRRERAHAIFSLMMGAVQLARITVDQKLAGRIIEGARTGALSIAHAEWGE
ncbi:MULTISPECIES: TetR/AcrR family transcriptional regulator [unclassified Erythrobacter]|uniref:TetR/AcrR family transcriptional regulator n=1 Tax=unclassified Erythrobacter TaxID=2633097 RepID=UPI0007B91DD1|nr:MULTISPECIES: TetR/AcrR family transcriptional regulator [unclassified Erythrobacter]